MLALKEAPIARKPFRPEERGYHNAYREGEVNYCPGCGRTHWLIGRILAECANCGTAKPLSGESWGYGTSAIRCGPFRSTGEFE
jgi:hypothetical protein